MSITSRFVALPGYCCYMDVGIRDLRANLSRYLAQVKQGAVIEVTDRDRPIARIVPVRPGEAGIPAEVASLIADGVVAWSGESFHAAVPIISLHGAGPTLAEIVSADRE